MYVCMCVTNDMEYKEQNNNGSSNIHVVENKVTSVNDSLSAELQEGSYMASWGSIL